MPTVDTPRRYGDYVLLESIGHGGMSAVDLARRSVDRAGFVRFLVIKRILKKNTADPTFVRMFMDEARINAELQHENIAQVYDFGERNGEWYIAMEYVPGIDLRRLQKAVAAGTEGGALLPPRISLRILHDVLSALQYAHHRVDTFGQPMNIVHRDVNPRNIMVSVRGEVKLIDFGVAKADNRQDQTTGQTIKGKFAYMAPEQIESPVPVDGRADLFAVGLVLQELLTGTHPFRNLSEIQIIHRLISGRVDPMPDCPLHPDPQAVREVRNRAMATLPDGRYADARAFQEGLVRLAAPLGGLASRAEVAGFFRRAAPDTAHQIAARLASWRDFVAPPSTPGPLAVPPDADLSDDTWASDMRTAEVPVDFDPSSMSGTIEPTATEGATVADAVPSRVDATVADPTPLAHLHDLGEQSASSVVVAAPRSTGNLPVIAAITIGGGLGLAGLAIIAVVFFFLSPAPEPVVVAANTAPAPVVDTPPPSPQPAAVADPPQGAGTDATEPEEPAPPPAAASKPKTKRQASPGRSADQPPKPDPTPADPAPDATPSGSADGPDPAATAKDAPTGEAAPPVESTPPPAVATGFLFATSRPSGLEVLFGGRSLGRTPLRNAVLPVGTHTVTLRDAETGQTWRKTVTIRENQPSMVKVQP